MADVTMPRLSDTMERGTIAKWLKREGDRVNKGEPLVEIETDKANMVLDSYDEGVLDKILVHEGQTAPIGELIATIAGQRGVGGPSAPAQPSRDVLPSGPAPSGALESSAPPPPSPAPPLEGENEERLKVSPIARRVAQEHGIDLAKVTGTGPGGRIIKEDVEEALQRPQAAPTAEAAASTLEQRPEAPAGAPTIEPGMVPMTRMQQTIAQRMVESKATAPHFYVTNEVQMDKANALLGELNEALRDQPKVGFNDLIIKAVAVALRRFPEVNASYRDGQIEFHQDINLGIAVAVPQGLIVPVLADADRKSLPDIAREAKELIAKTRSNRLSPAEREGGTFTVSNMGMYDVDQFAAIITPRQSAILAVGSIREVPAVIDGQIRPVKQARLTLSADHRVFYGATAAQFLQEIKRLLQTPLLLLL